MKVKSETEVAQSCPTLSDAMDCSLPGQSVHGIFQARVLEWGAIAFSVWHCSKPLFQTQSFDLFGHTMLRSHELICGNTGTVKLEIRVFGTLGLRTPAAAAAAAKSCPTPCDPVDGSPSGSSCHGILQARTLEWIAIAFSTQKLIKTHRPCICLDPKFISFFAPLKKIKGKLDNYSPQQWLALSAFMQKPFLALVVFSFSFPFSQQIILKFIPYQRNSLVATLLRKLYFLFKAFLKLCLLRYHP